ncbi:MAG: epimerase [Actinomycetota bacterium]|nr:epimerase [Actinomycetota bacterium]MDG2121792.1 epimerase [Actinomycetota bacterium]
METALVIGGTGPTGPLIVNGLTRRGYKVTILHTGRHETDLISDEVEHIHTNPFDRNASAEAIGTRTFDLGVVMYGRLRDLVELLAGKIGHLVTIGGVGVYHGFANPDDLFPEGLPVPNPSSAELVGDNEYFRKLRKIRETEEAVFDLHPEAIHLRYPQIYGPRQILPREWPIVRRAIDRRPTLIVPDGGLTLKSQMWIENAAHATLLACARPISAIGNIYNVSDQQLLSIAQIAEIVADEVGHEWELISIPHYLAPSTRPMLTSWSNTHRVLDIAPAVTDLGYSDVKSPVQAWREATRYLLQNRPENGGRVEQQLNDPFEYKSEDIQIAIFKKYAAALREVDWVAEPGYSSAYVGKHENPAARAPLSEL